MYYVAVEARVHKMLRSGGGGRCRGPGVLQLLGRVVLLTLPFLFDLMRILARLRDRFQGSFNSVAILEKDPLPNIHQRSCRILIFFF